jgi:hypothetical protein
MRAPSDAGKNGEGHLGKGVSEQGRNCITYLLKLLPLAAPEPETWSRSSLIRSGTPIQTFFANN